MRQVDADPADYDENGVNGAVRPVAQFKGYVSNYQLVIEDEGTVPLGNRLLFVTQRTIVGKLIPRIADGGTIERLDIESMTFAGRIGLDDAIAVQARFEVFGARLCDIRTEFERSAVDLCRSQDLVRNRNNDNQNQPCDAISFGFSATGVNALVENPTISRRFILRPEPTCAALPNLDGDCRPVDAGPK